MTDQEKQKIKNLKLAFIGRPGSGKGTQVKSLAKKFGLVLIPSPGDIYRDPDFRATPMGKKVAELVDQGIFAPNEVTNQLMKDQISALTNHGQMGFVSEGYPRTLPQAEFADKEIGLDWVINLEVSEDRLISRLSNRRVCPQCKKNYNFITNPPKDGSTCDDCHLPLIQRDDDKPEAIKKRFMVYHETAEPTINYYRRQKKIIDINGDQPIEKVFQDIVDALSKLV